MRVLIVGCGYVGLPLGGMLAKRGHEVHGLRRTDNVREAMNEAGIQPHIIDITKRGQLDALPGPFDWIISHIAARMLRALAQSAVIWVISGSSPSNFNSGRKKSTKATDKVAP